MTDPLLLLEIVSEHFDPEALTVAEDAYLKAWLIYADSSFEPLYLRRLWEALNKAGLFLGSGIQGDRLVIVAKGGR